MRVELTASSMPRKRSPTELQPHFNPRIFYHTFGITSRPLQNYLLEERVRCLDIPCILSSDLTFGTDCVRLRTGRIQEVAENGNSNYAY